MIEEGASSGEQHRQEGLVAVVDARLSRNSEELAWQSHRGRLVLLEAVGRRLISETAVKTFQDSNSQTLKGRGLNLLEGDWGVAPIFVGGASTRLARRVVDRSGDAAAGGTGKLLLKSEKTKF